MNIAVMEFKFSLLLWLEKDTYGERTKAWKYFVELDGLSAFFEANSGAHCPTIRELNMQGPEGINGIFMRFAEYFCRGLSSRGKAQGHPNKVLALSPLFLPFILILSQTMLEFIQGLYQRLDVVRAEAEVAAEQLFNDDKTIPELEASRSAHQLSPYSGNKPEKIEAYRLRYVAAAVAEQRIGEIKTRKVVKEMRRWLRHYRLIFYSFRRLTYLSFKKAKGEKKY